MVDVAAVAVATFQSKAPEHSCAKQYSTCKLIVK